MSTQSSTISSISERYATALFGLAKEAGSLDAVAGDLAAIAALIDQSEDLTRLLRSPVFKAEEQIAGLNGVLDRLDIGELTRNFVNVVAQNRRLFALADMARQFRALLAAERGEVVAKVTAAHAMSDRQQADLQAELKAMMKTDVQMDVAVDETLLGGLIVQVGSRMIDSSLRTKLQNLEFAMKGAE